MANGGYHILDFSNVSQYLIKSTPVPVEITDAKIVEFMNGLDKGVGGMPKAITYGKPILISGLSVKVENSNENVRVEGFADCVGLVSSGSYTVVIKKNFEVNNVTRQLLMYLTTDKKVKLVITT